MAIQGSTVVMLEDKTFDTIENIFKYRKTNEFTTYGLDTHNQLVTVQITNIRPVRYINEEICHFIISSFNMYASNDQTIVMGDGKFKQIKNITSDDYLKCKYVYLNNGITSDSIDIQCKIRSLWQEVHENDMLYAFDQNLTHNMCIPTIYGYNRTALWPEKMSYPDTTPDVFFIALGDEYIMLKDKFTKDTTPSEFISGSTLAL